MQPISCCHEVPVKEVSFGGSVFLFLMKIPREWLHNLIILLKNGLLCPMSSAEAFI